MSRDLELVRSQVEADRCRGAAAGVGIALAITDDEVVTAKAGLFGWGQKVRRFNLDRLTYVGHTPNSYGDALCVQFDNATDLRFTIRFEPWAREAFAPIIAALKQRVERRPAEVSR